MNSLLEKIIWTWQDMVNPRIDDKIHLCELEGLSGPGCAEARDAATIDQAFAFLIITLLCIYGAIITAKVALKFLRYVDIYFQAMRSERAEKQRATS